MANLIITVISIALVAVAALMGAYYGGEAYMQGQAKAKANEIVNAFEQVSAALQMFQANGSVLTYNLTASGYNYGSDLSQLVPSYIQQIPSVGVFGITLNPSFNHTSDKVFMFKLINYNFYEKWYAYDLCRPGVHMQTTGSNKNRQCTHIIKNLFRLEWRCYRLHRNDWLSI